MATGCWPASSFGLTDCYRFLGFKTYAQELDDRRRVREELQALQSNSPPAKVNLNFLRLLPNEWRALLEELKDSQHVERLLLRQCGVGDDEVATLARALRNSGVQVLHLGANQIGPAGAGALAESLSEIPLKILHISDNAIKDEGLASLAAGVVRLDDFFAFRNEIGDMGAQALAGQLPFSSLGRLVLSFNNISGQGAAALAEGLRNSQVVWLELDSNPLGNDGARALAEHLCVAPVRLLNIDNAQIQLDGANALASCLRTSSLTNLSLEGNNFGEEGWQSLLQTICGSGLETLRTTHCSEETLEQIRAALRFNKERAFVVQVERIEAGAMGEETFLCRTAGGTVLARLPWAAALPMADLPQAILKAMKCAESPALPFKQIQTHHVHVVLPDGEIVRGAR